MSEQKIIGLEKKDNEQIIRFTTDALSKVSPTVGAGLTILSGIVNDLSRAAISQTIGAVFELSTRLLETVYIGIINVRDQLLTARMEHITKTFVERVGKASVYAPSVQHVYLRSAASEFLKQMGKICPQIATVDEIVASLV